MVLFILLSGACRVAGPEGSPTDLRDVDADLPAAGGGRGDGSGENDSAVIPEHADAGQEDDAAAGYADDAEMPMPDAGATPPSGTDCRPPAGIACDPVSGQGCLPLMQCLVDPNSSAPAAFCVFGGIQLDITCAQDGFSTNCPPQHTCVMGVCRKYCYCDADCESGAACTDPSGEGGSTVFKLCAQPAP